MATRVYKFGALPVPQDSPIREQMKLGHQYYNALVDAENRRRAKYIWLLEVPEGERVKAPSPPHPKPVEGKWCKCDECQEWWEDLKQRARDTKFLDLKPLRGEFSAKGLLWGTYLKIEEAFNAAVKKTRPWCTVKFRPWRKGAVCAVQVQKDKDPESYYRVEKAYDPRTGRRSKPGRQILHLRVTKGRNPSFSPIKFEQHREIEGRVAWVYTRLDHYADREKWHIYFVCADVPPKPGVSKNGIVAIDCGWRQLGSKMRIGVARGVEGDISEVFLPASWLGLVKKADDLRSIRDTLLNELKKADPRFALVKSPGGARRVMRETMLAQELGPKNASAVAYELRPTTWEKRDRHLWQYEVGCRRRISAVRRDILANWVCMLRRKYNVVILKDTQHKILKERAKDDGLPRPARRQGHHGAPGETVEALLQAFTSGGTVAVVPAKNTTGECTHCHHINKHGPEAIITCENCGDEVDRDLASTWNMLSLYFADDWSPPTARKTTPRFAKLHVKSGQEAQC